MRRELHQEKELLRTICLLESIPGVGFFSAVLLVLELWDISRFRDEAHLASYIGFVPSTHQTGQTMYHGKMTKQGNVLVRWVLVQDAWNAVGTNGFFAARYEYYRSKKGAGRAIVPVTRALLKTIVQVWSLRKEYSELYEKKALVG
jgi:transposase